MSSISSSGRAILNGLPEGGYPLGIGYNKTVVHTAIEGTAQLDTLYVFGYAVRRAPGAVAGVQVEASVLDKNNSEYVIASVTLPGLPCTSPTIVINGQVKNNGARIRLRALDGNIAVFGWYNRTTISVPPSVNTVIGQMSLGYQTISFSSDSETRIVDVSTPVTFITTSHTTATRCRATLGQAAIGTLKMIVMSGKNPAASSIQGACTVIPSSSRFPAGEDGVTPTGTLSFIDVGDSAILMWTGTLWMIVGSGAVVD